MAKLTEAEVELLKNTFKGNDALLIAVRKKIFPEYDIDGGVGEQTDLWISMDFSGMSTEEAMINIKARNMFIAQLEGGLDSIKKLCEFEGKTPEQIKEAAVKNSSK